VVRLFLDGNLELNFADNGSGVFPAGTSGALEFQVSTSGGNTSLIVLFNGMTILNILDSTNPILTAGSVGITSPGGGSLFGTYFVSGS
jgi:hypothetical protein